MCRQLCGRLCHTCVVDPFCVFGRTLAEITLGLLGKKSTKIVVHFENRLKYSDFKVLLVD